MATAITPLANITLGSSAATVSFTSISGSYRDLLLVSSVTGLAGSPVSAGAFARFNSDSGSNYSTVYMYGNGSSTGSGTEATTTLFWGAFPAAGGNHLFQILDYSATDKHKSVLGRANGNGASVWAHAGRWASTAAITSIVLTAPDYGTQTFNAGSTFMLYGVSA